MPRLCYILFMLTLSLSGCQDDVGVPDIREGEQVHLFMRFSYDDPETVGTKAISQNGADENGISDLNLFIFDVNGNLLNQKYFSGSVSPVAIATSSGQRNIVAVANVGSAITSVTKLSELTALTAQAASPSAMLNASNNFVMVKQTGIITIPVPSTPGGNVSISPIYLERLCAKVTTTFTYNLNTGVQITPVKIRLCQVPNSCLYIGSNTPSSSGQILSRGDSLYLPSGITSTAHATAVPLYMFENRQGDNGTNTVQSQKTPATGKANYCSYLEVTANYSSLLQSGLVIYRYYLGTNTLTNFDVTRNTWYQISITFNGNGGITENSWRVNVAGLGSTILPSTLYIPYYSARSQLYNFNSASVASTLNSLSSTGQFGVVMDSTLFVMSKTDNGSSVVTLGTATANSKNYTIVMLPKGPMEFFTDVSSLDFPQNNIFGSKNYPITQYIQIFNTGSGVGAWTARSTASWLYIGKGSDFSAFSASGVANTWTTTNMYNSQTGFLSSSSANTSIAVRCDVNTGVSRSAYIIFTAGNNQEVARVYIRQNPASYPKAPIGLRYVPGGVFKPGAYDAGGTLVSSPPQGSSTSALWIQITPFYMAGRECSIQNFADYLNDLGITDPSVLTAVIYDPLDKALLFNYPGLLTGLVTGPAFNPGNGGPLYSGNLWKIPSQTVKINGSNISSFASAPIGNFPMVNVSYYGAYDYGYWVSKYSGIASVSRVNTRGIPTDMQWEAAARGINNGFTSKTAFNNATSTTKNGLFPFPFPSQTFNSGISEIEGSTLDILKAISLFQNFAASATGTTQYSTISQLPCGNMIPNSLYIHDLSGNVQEWTLDNYQGQNLSFGILTDFYTSPVNNGAGLGLASDRVVRGGSSALQPAYCTNAYRINGNANTYSTQTGFRFVINP